MHIYIKERVKHYIINVSIFVTFCYFPSFLRAGAELVVTTSYQAWIQGLVQHQGITEDEAFNLIKKSVQIGKQACLEVAEEQGRFTFGLPKLVFPTLV
jgi:S-methylmethionine-dependent homocysteine/selenocysteine methylase